MNAIKCGWVAADFAEPDEVSDGADGAGEETLSCGDVGAGEAAAAEADAAEVYDEGAVAAAGIRQ